MMKAWRVHPSGALQLDDVPVPLLPRDWAEVAVCCFQVSTTEVRALEGRATYAADLVDGKLENQSPASPFGHEFSGRVISSANGIAPGARVAALGQIGQSVVGLDIPGCFAERVRLPDEALVTVSDSISDEDAAGLQPLSSAIAAFRSGSANRGDAVVVFGLGTMGLFLIQLSRLAGIRVVVGVGRRREQLDAATAAGATHVIDAGAEDVAAAIRDATEQRGANVFFEAAGAVTESDDVELPRRATGLEIATEIAAHRAAIVQVGHFHGAVEIVPSLFRRKSVRLVFPEFAGREDLVQAESLVSSGRVRVLASHLVNGMEHFPMALQFASHRAAHKVVGSVRVRVKSASQ